MSVLFEASIIAAMFASLTEPLLCARAAGCRAGRAAGCGAGCGAGAAVGAGSDFGGNFADGFTGLKSRQLVVRGAAVTIAIAVRRQSIAHLRGARTEAEDSYDDSG